MVYINISYNIHKIVSKIIMHADKEILSLLMLSSFITVMNTQNCSHVTCLNTNAII